MDIIHCIVSMVHLSLSHASAMVQVGLHSTAERRSQASCELLAQLQEFAAQALRASVKQVT